MKLAIACLLFAANVRIIDGPSTERVDPDFAIIRWTVNTPGGSPVRYGVVRYGTDPRNLNQLAKSPIRLNPGHPVTVFRVRVPGLKPRTTYYYTVDSMEANGTSDGVKSGVRQFTTPGESQSANRRGFAENFQSSQRTNSAEGFDRHPRASWSRGDQETLLKFAGWPNPCRREASVGYRRGSCSVSKIWNKTTSRWSLS